MVFDNYSIYLENWIKYENLALQAENDELNIHQNKSWKNKKKDGKSLWNAIDWKGKSEMRNETQVDENIISKYFYKIFQSENTKDNPIIQVMI